MVCPWDGEGYNQTLHRNFLLPISNNLGQVEEETLAEGVGPKDETTPAPQAHNELPANGLTKSQPGSLHNLLAKQHKLVDPELARLATPDPVNDGSQTGQDQSIPQRWSMCMRRNHLTWRYQNVILQQNNTSSSAFAMWDGLHTCLHLMVGLYNAFGKSTVWRHSTWTIINISDTNNLWYGWGLHWCSFYDGFLDGMGGPRDIWSEHSCPTTYKPHSQLLIETLWVSGQYNPKSNV